MKKIMFLGLVLVAFIAISKSSVNAQGVRVNGFMQGWLYLNQQNPIDGIIEDATSGLRLRRARIGVRGDLDNVFSINTMLDFAATSSNLYDFAFVAKVAPELVFTVGQFIAPLQMYETGRLSSSSITIYEVSDIARNLSENMGFNSYRDVGIMVSGALNMLKYYAYYGNGHGRLTFAGNNILNRKLSDGLYGLRLEVEPTKGLSIGAQYSINSQDNVNTSSSGVVFRDRNSFSADIATQGFGLSFLSAILSYGMGEVKDRNFDYDGLSATLMFDITKQFQVVGRFDTYNRKPTGGAEESNYNNIVFGLNWYYFKDNSELFKIGINYHIMNEDDNNKRDNDVLLLWTQIKF